MRTLTLTLSLWACSPQDSAVPPCCAEDVAPDAALPTTSLFHLDATWQDQHAAERRLADFRGKLTVVAMIFTHCTYACPRILADLRSIEAGLAPALQNDVRFLLVSMDPARDTPGVLRAYAAEQDLDLARWTLLHGADADVRELAALLGVQFKPLPNGDFSHSNLITVLDREGRVAHRQSGLDAPIAPTLDEIARLVQ